MKRSICVWFIAFCILTQLSAPFQNSSRAQDIAPLHVVLLEQPSVVEKIMEWVPQEFAEFRQDSLGSSSARRYHDLVRERQSRWVDSLRRQRIQVLERRSLVLNMLLVRGPQREIEQLAAREEVRGVYPNRQRFLLMDSAPTVVGAPAFWGALGGIDKPVWESGSES